MLITTETRKGDLANEYADARVEAESGDLNKRSPDHHAQRPFEDVEGLLLGKSKAEEYSARELVGFMNG